eukprot:GDKJ01042935.1.p1 GENE.GDKJ01042935.1~~GDKJ01042935.1.p1  ORF type:complete len:303 (-),score=40.98 GDKJ01042935.1:54-962(-)
MNVKNSIIRLSRRSWGELSTINKTASDVSHLRDFFEKQRTSTELIKYVANQTDTQCIHVQNEFSIPSHWKLLSKVLGDFSERTQPQLKIDTNFGSLSLIAQPEQSYFMTSASPHLKVFFSYLLKADFMSKKDFFTPAEVGMLYHEFHHAIHFLHHAKTIENFPYVFREVIGLGSQLLGDCQDVLSTVSLSTLEVNTEHPRLSKDEIPADAWVGDYLPSRVSARVKDLGHLPMSERSDLSFEDVLCNQGGLGVMENIQAMMILQEVFDLDWQGGKWVGNLSFLQKEAIKWSVDEWREKTAKIF